MFNFKSKEDKFYKIFLEVAKNTNEAALIFRESLNSLSNKEHDIITIEELEHKGDQLVHSIIKELNEAFITPIDREDIYLLIKKMDDILDLINSTMHMFIMFNINESTTEAKMLADMIIKCTKLIVELMDELNLIGSKSKNIKEKIVEIDKIETDADSLFRTTVGKLFKNEPDALEVIKWKEVYQILEDTIDKCKKVGNIVEGVVIKNA